VEKLKWGKVSEKCARELEKMEKVGGKAGLKS
jgi:hypothetical protein